MKATTEQLQQVIECFQSRSKVLAITSGKGGVGKTNIAANLAITLGALNQKVLLVDADLSLGNLDVLMGINSKYNISHMIKGVRTLEQIIQPGPANTEIICGVSGLEDIANINEFQRQRLIKELLELQNNNDALIVDTSAGLSKSVVGFCLAADHVLVVTTPEATAITDAYAMIKVLVGNRFRDPISLVVNLAETIAEGRNTYQQIASVSARFLNTHIYNAGVLLKDEHLQLAIRQRKPVVLAYPKARISLSIAALATKLTSVPIKHSNSEGVFKRFVDWFF